MKFQKKKIQKKNVKKIDPKENQMTQFEKKCGYVALKRIRRWG